MISKSNNRLQFNNKITFFIFILLGILIIFSHYKLKGRPDKEVVKKLLKRFTKPELLYKPAPDIKITLLNGKSFKLSKYIKKKIIIINFFTTWCGPCKDEIQELNRFYEKNKHRNLIMIGIDVGEKENKVRKFVAENKIKYPIGIIKAKSKIADNYKIKAFPTTVFIGFRGRVELYEKGAISNADMIFNSLMKINERRYEYKKKESPEN